VKEWYELFNDNKPDLTLVEKLEKLTTIGQYFDRIAATCRRDIKAIARGPQTVRNIKSVYEIYQWSEAKMMGYFGTNINENLFSQVRAKSRYVTLVEVFSTVDRAYAELVKRNCDDLPYCYPQTQMSQCYNNQTVLKYKMEDIPFGKGEGENGKKKLVKEKLPKKLLEILEENHPTRRKMTLRLGTCFSNPYGSNKKNDCKVACPFSFQNQLQPNQKRCTQQPYTMRGALETHLCKEHNIPKEALREWMAKAELWSINGGEATPTTNSENVAKYREQYYSQLDNVFWYYRDYLANSIIAVFPGKTVFIVDFETTGFEADKQRMYLVRNVVRSKVLALEVAIVAVNAQGCTYLHSFVQPTVPINPHAEKVHGISLQHLANVGAVDWKTVSTR
jgi:hypothetical protein